MEANKSIKSDGKNTPRLMLGVSFVNEMRNEILILLSILMASLIFSGCASTKVEYLKPESFMEMAKRWPTSAHGYSYIGASRKKIYIEFETVLTSTAFLGLSNRPAYTIYWTAVEKIPKEFVDSLEKQKHKQRLGNPYI